MPHTDKGNCLVINLKSASLGCLHVYVYAWLCLVLPMLSACESLLPAHQPALLHEAVDQQWRDWQQDGQGEQSTANTLGQSPVKAKPNPSYFLLDINAVDAPIDAILLALAADAGVVLTIHQRLAGKVTLRVHGQTLKTVLELLSQQVALSWQLGAGVLDVWGSDPYTRSYAVDYLNLDRTTLSSVGLATQVGSINANLGETTSSVTNSSETLIKNQALHRFWDSLAADLEGMRQQVQSGDAGLSYTINRDAGLVTLYAAAGVHQQLQRYLHKLNNSVRRQVVIEATVVEVTLLDQFEAGVDWQFLASGSSGINGVQKLLGLAEVNGASVSRLPSPSALFSLVQKSRHGDVSATLSLLQQFGDVRILSRPRIIALNNQASVLKVVDNRVYFSLNVERESRENTDQVSTKSEIHTVPVGLVMNVTPFIGEDNDVMLNVRPSLSRIIGFVNDPNPELAAANVRNGVPEIQVREMESMLRVKSGELAIIGGLMQDVVEDKQQHLPGLARLPGVGKLFSSNKRQRRQTELLVVLRPTVMPNSDTPLIR